MSMRVVVFETTDFMGIKHAVISPEGDDEFVLIAGENGAGKTSIFKAFNALLGGVKEAPQRPIRDGADSAELFCRLEDSELDKEFEVTRIFTTDKKGQPKTSLKLSSKDGKLTSPQKILAKILGRRSLNPLDFMRLPGPEQRARLETVVDLGINLHDHKQARDLAFHSRTAVNRDVKRLKIELQASPEVGDIPAYIDADELLAKLEGLTAKEQEKVNAQHALTQMRAEVGRKQQAIGVAEVRLTGAKNVLATADAINEDAIAAMKVRHFDELQALEAQQKANVQAQEEAVSDHEAEVERAKDIHSTFVEEGKQAAAATELLLAVDYSEEIGETRAAISDAGATNTENARLETLAEQRVKLNEDLHVAIADAANLDKEIESLDQLRATSLAEANMPIEGLDIGDDCLLYNDLPLDQACGADQLQVALAIAAALSPDLDDIMVQDGPLLSKKSLEIVRKFAKEKGLRFWIERSVDTHDEGCIIIEEGIIEAAA